MDLSHPAPSAATRASSLRAWELGAIALVAALPRLTGLRHVSLWLDEILTTLRLGQPFAHAWSALRDDAVHPPLPEVVAWPWYRLVEAEPARRLLPIAFGVGTVVVLAILAMRWFGRRASWAVAILASLSPLHVHYSQELRGYSLALLFVALSLLAADRAGARPSRRTWLGLSLAVAASWWSLYVTAFALPALAALALSPRGEAGALRQRARGFAGALALAAALYLPWLSVLRSGFEKQHEQSATIWNLALLGERLQFLTVGGVEGRAVSGGALFAVALAIAGAWSARRGAVRAALLAGSLSASVGVELVLLLDDHWSNGRYDLVAWPFLMILIALGAASVGDRAERLAGGLATSRSRVALRFALQSAPLILLLLFQLAGLRDYFARGRPDWLSVARTAASFTRDGRPILVDSEWTRVTLGYYLAELDGASPPEISSRVRLVDPAALSDPSTLPPCSVLVQARSAPSPAFDALALSSPLRARFPRTGARVVSISDARDALDVDPFACLEPGARPVFGERAPTFSPGEAAELLVPPGERRRAIDAPGARPLFGWSDLERRDDGLPFRWAVGRWAAVGLPARPARRLTLTFYALDDSQTLAVTRGREILWSGPLSRERRTLEFELPAGFGDRAPEFLLFGFSRFERLENDGRPLAACLERFELSSD